MQRLFSIGGKKVLHKAIDSQFYISIVLLKELSQDGSAFLTNLEALTENALSLAGALYHILSLSSAEKAELEELATQLWNKAVILKSKKSLSAISLAKMRHVSFLIVTHLYESTNDEITLKKHIIMALKTARAWIDCSEWENAEKVLYIFHQTIQKLQHVIIEKKALDLTQDALNKMKFEMDRDVFQGLCLTAELRFGKSQQNEAMSLIEKAKELMERTFPNEAGFLSLLCYNFGVDCFKEKNFEAGAFWLKESYDIGKDAVGVSTGTQASILRLLATCYMEEKNQDWLENALNAVILANKIDPQPSGVFLKLQLNVLAEDPNLMLASYQELLNHEDCSLEYVLNAIHLLKKYEKPDVAFHLRQEVLKKFELHPDFGMLLITLLDTFLIDSDSHLAKTLAEECIIAHNTISRLDGASLKRFHVLFWSKAAKMFENENYNEALVWYNYSLSLYSSMCPSEPNLGKLQRNLATCYLLVGETAKALAALEVSERCEPNNAHTQFITFKLALAMNDFEKALDSLNKLVELSPKDENTNNIICLAAHTALEQEKSELAIPALECLINHSSDDKLILIAIRCLLRLFVTQMEDNQRINVDSAISQVRTAYNKILVVKDIEKTPTAEIQDEALWFMKIAWNLAIKLKDDVYAVKELFALSYQLLTLCPINVGDYIQGNHCLLMCCAACLQIARSEKDKSVVQNVLEEVLNNVEEYRQGERRVEKYIWAQGLQMKSSQEEKLLILYEFEALIKLNDPRAETVLEKALILPNPEPKLFHTLAAVALNSSAYNLKLGAKALKISIRLHLEAPTIDYVKCSADLRNLIELTMNRNEEEEALIYLEEAVDVLSKAKDAYPEIEIVWLMTKSWNYGLQQYNCCKYHDAEQWCSKSMKFLKYLSSAKENYKEQMITLYQELLNHLDNNTSTGRFGET